jgi:uncharacterized protein involved in response to NO
MTAEAAGAANRGTAMQALRRARMENSPAFLRGGFRPFFLGGAVWALIVVGLWVAAMAGALTLPTAFEPLVWHRHEMLFGYLGAVIAGFVLTAIPNWTGRLPIAGGPLALLFVLWLAARVAVLCSSVIGAGIALGLDTGFFLLLFALAAREVIAAKNRNVPIVIILFLFAAANTADHLEAIGLLPAGGFGWRGGFALVLMLIALIGGRIIPSFTRNWLFKQGWKTGLPKQPGIFDKMSLALTFVALAGWAALPDARGTGMLLVAAAIVQAIRLGRWSGLATTADPLVLILHLGFAWVPLGLLLLGLSILGPTVPATTAMHALAAGAMGTMTLAVMTRATLGHTGRALRADAPTTILYVLVTLGAVLRVAAPVLPFDYMHMIECAGLLWGGAFLLFVLAYGPKLIGNRPDGRL